MSVKLAAQYNPNDFIFDHPLHKIRICKFYEHSKLYNDATGTLCKKIERPNNNISGQGIARSIAGEVNLKSYIDKSFSIVSMKSNSTLKTFIRVDYSHVMKFVSNWSCFKGSNIDVKKFYL
ncbi:hypothetical protein ACI65C_012123 [Semiaphis heraclei]